MCETVARPRWRGQIGRRQNQAEFRLPGGRWSEQPAAGRWGSRCPGGSGGPGRRLRRLALQSSSRLSWSPQARGHLAHRRSTHGCRSRPNLRTRVRAVRRSGRAQSGRTGGRVSVGCEDVVGCDVCAEALLVWPAWPGQALCWAAARQPPASPDAAAVPTAKATPTPAPLAPMSSRTAQIPLTRLITEQEFSKRSRDSFSAPEDGRCNHRIAAAPDNRYLLDKCRIGCRGSKREFCMGFVEQQRGVRDKTRA